VLNKIGPGTGVEHHRDLRGLANAQYQSEHRQQRQRRGVAKQLQQRFDVLGDAAIGADDQPGRGGDQYGERQTRGRPQDAGDRVLAAKAPDSISRSAARTTSENGGKNTRSTNPVRGKNSQARQNMMRARLRRVALSMNDIGRSDNPARRRHNGCLIRTVETRLMLLFPY
jgi:hypothetical protein